VRFIAPANPTLTVYVNRRAVIDIYKSKRLYQVRRPFAAFLAGATIATLGGLIGLGGAEFRLPLLIMVFALYAHRAVRINLLISLATLAFSAASRFGFAGASNITVYEPIILAMIAGGMVSAWLGAGFMSRLPKDRISTLIAALLLIVAAVLLIEAVFPLPMSAALPSNPAIELPVALAAGLLVGTISSLLGVAGGEFIIPILVIAFGADIKTAGTASVLISAPLVLTGIVRHILNGMFRSRTLLARLVIPMSAGSALGAIAGGYAAQWAPSDFLKGILAVILAVSSLKLFRSH
jgi:uncharacterized protein